MTDNTEIKILTEPVVKAIKISASDDDVIQAAQVSVVGENNPDTDSPRLINYLMSYRHGSPFEHGRFTFYIKAPIFVFREVQRHRIASYNERSARYSELPPEFYVPAGDRPLINVGTSARPKFEAGDEEMYYDMQEAVMEAYVAAWESYTRMLDLGIGKEIARIVLPVGIYSELYVTMNPRGLMNFLSLRTENEEAAVPSHPQYEIQQVANRMEELFAEAMPHTHAAFVKNGRLAP